MAKIYLKDLPEDIQDCISDDESDKTLNLQLVVDGDWEDGGKYDYKENIWEYNGKLYSHNSSRSGSYFTEYHHENDDFLTEVEAKQKTVTFYEPI